MMLPFYERGARAARRRAAGARAQAIDWSTDDAAATSSRGSALARTSSRCSRPQKSVRALCVARESLAYASPLADAIFAVQGLASHPLAAAPGVDRWRARIDDVARGRARSAASRSPSPRRGATSPRCAPTARREGDALGARRREDVHLQRRHRALLRRLRERRSRRSARRGSARSSSRPTRPGSRSSPSRRSTTTRSGASSCAAPRGELVGEVGQGLRLALGTLDVLPHLGRRRGRRHGASARSTRRSRT